MKKTNFDFVKLFKVFGTLSLLAVLGSVFIMYSKGFNLGVDFRGGAELQIKFKTPIVVDQLRSDLDATGFQISSVQSIGAATENEYLVKVLADAQNLSRVTDEFAAMFNTKYADKGAEIRKTDIVGPKAGEELRNSGIKAMIWALLSIMIYVSLRFEFKFAPGAIIALIHDVIITCGALIVTGREFNLQSVAALLAIIGYSVNDTVIIYDRIRENETAHPNITTAENINKSVNETLSRSLLTSAATLTVSFGMYIFGVGVIHDFFFAICVGIVAGAYSTTFVATPMTLLFEKLMKKKPSTSALA